MLKHLDAKPRLLIAILVAVSISLLLPQWMHLATRIIVAWDIGVIIFLTFFFNTVILALAINILASLI